MVRQSSPNRRSNAAARKFPTLDRVLSNDVPGGFNVVRVHVVRQRRCGNVVPARHTGVHHAAAPAFDTFFAPQRLDAPRFGEARDARPQSVPTNRRLRPESRHCPFFRRIPSKGWRPLRRPRWRRPRNVAALFDSHKCYLPLHLRLVSAIMRVAVHHKTLFRNGTATDVKDLLCIVYPSTT